MTDAMNPDFNAPEVKAAIDNVATQKTAEVITYFQKVAQVAVLAATPEADREKVADDRLTKIANGKLPGAMIASIMMHEVTNNKEAALADAAQVGSLRQKVAAASASTDTTKAATAGASALSDVRKLVSEAK